MSRLALFLSLLLLAAAPARAAEFGPLVEPAALSEAHSDTLIIDIRAPEDYAAGHVPNAVNAPYPRWRGPKENPGRVLSDAELTALFQDIGVTKDRGVVVTYEGADATEFGGAARVYWTLKSAGIAPLSILNGGVEAWKAAGLPLAKDKVVPAHSQIDVHLSHEWMMDREEVAAVVDGRSDARLIDARPTDFFEGRKKHDAAAEAGTLKGAYNLVFSSWFGKDEQRIDASPESVRKILARAGVKDPDNPDEKLVSFCNTGHWAATNWFVLSEVAGIKDVKLYPESMVGWTNAGGPVVN